MKSAQRIAHRPAPPRAEVKGSRRLRGSGRTPRTGASTTSRADAMRTAVPTTRKREAKRLVEDYWQSVWHSRHEPPLYHTYSDRYGGAHGIPYATLKSESFGTPIAARYDVRASAASFGATVPDCLAAADAAFSNGCLAEAQTQLQHALTVLQNGGESRGLLTVAALSQFRGAGTEDAQRSFWVAEVLRRLGTLELIRGHYSEARELLHGSISADPLYLNSYLLRAACCEALRLFAEAYEDYSKYMKMTEPSMEVLAHSGKCAAEAGLLVVAREQLGRLLELSEGILAKTAAAHETRDSSNNTDVALLSSSLPPLVSAAWAAGSITISSTGEGLSSLELLRSACAFYVTHAYFYLGYVAEVEAASSDASAVVTALRRKASRYYSVAMRNTDYVESYEDSVSRAMQVGDYALARHLLLYLQKMNPNRASYFLDAARVCQAEGDAQGELRALSAALDRQQTSTDRRATLFARGAVYADQLCEWSRAIRDFTLLLAIPPATSSAGTTDGEAELVDWCTPLALVRRAAAYRHRQEEGIRASLLQHEDEEAALADYAAFLDSLAEMTTAGGLVETDMPELCQSPNVIAALLVLANGAHHRHQHSNAVHYFCRAIALGWQPESSTISTLLPPSERLPDQLYTSMAHHVMTLYPQGEDMFRVPYEAREASTTALSSSLCAPADARRATKMNERAGANGNRANTSEGERSGFACPPLLYTMVDQRYQQLRALEPTFFSAIEDDFLDAWEPYRAEVERLKDEALSVRGGRRGKR